MGSLFKRYRYDDGGNFAIMFAVVISLLVLAVAVVIETSRMYGTRAVLQDMADSAALSGAYIAKTDMGGREDTVRNNIRFHQAYIPDLGLAANADVKFDDVNEELSVMIPRTFPSFFGGVLGADNLVVSATSIVSYKSEAIDPVSIAFALDVSGSMGNNTDNGSVKINVLKQSTKLLFNELEAASERPDLLVNSVRTGMSAYNTDIVSTVDMLWGWTHLEKSVDDLVAVGGTNSTPALEQAYEQLKIDRSVRVSANPKFQMSTLREYVVFMTDGDNNQPIWDVESAMLCEQMRTDGIEIYSIAFTAPEKGQLLLLDCASWDSGVEPEDESQYEDDPTDLDGGYDVTIDANGKKIKKCKKSNGKGKGKAKGKAKGRCKKEEDKLDYFFDAEDAHAFKEAFASIGKEIAQNTIRITG